MKPKKKTGLMNKNNTPNWICILFNLMPRYFAYIHKLNAQYLNQTSNLRCCFHGVYCVANWNRFVIFFLSISKFGVCRKYKFPKWIKKQNIDFLINYSKMASSLRIKLRTKTMDILWSFTLLYYHLFFCCLLHALRKFHKSQTNKNVFIAFHFVMRSIENEKENKRFSQCSDHNFCVFSFSPSV